MDRDSFLQRVRQAAIAGHKFRTHLSEEIPPGAGYVGAGDDPLGHFVAQVTSVGGNGQTVANVEQARQSLEEILDNIHPASVLCWQHDVLARLGLEEILRTRHIELLDHQTLQSMDEQTRRKKVLDAGLGISSVSYAVAETGTLVMASAPGCERLASLLPPVHLALLHAGQVVPDLFDLFSRVEESSKEGLPSNLSFITGPSKTGDIELQLTTGVHGPGTIHVIAIRETL